MERNYFMVRAMTSSENDFKVFFDNSVVAVGWSEIDFSKYDQDNIEGLAAAVKAEYYYSPRAWAPTVSKKLNEVRRFHSINVGDYLIIPFSSAIRLAVADKKRLYDSKAYDLDLSNQRKVKYILSGDTFKTIPRDVLSEAFQSRLRVQGSTVSNLYEFKDEIEKLFNKDDYTWSLDFEENETKLKDSFKEKLISKIKSGKTNLKTGGIGLEHLVQELLRCEGYEAQVLAKTTFQFGDADVYAFKSDKFQETKILIQVKHHKGYTSEWGLQQLDEIKKNAERNDHIYVLITSAEIDIKVREIAEEKDIVVIDGGKLSEWILDNLNKLSAGTKIKLGISSVPQFSD